jgi:tRNA-Thr(GGU) m(6)t(6)A37 methyltransferase TsaA
MEMAMNIEKPESQQTIGQVEVIGTLHCDVTQKGDLPRQSGLGAGPSAVIELDRGHPASMLDDLQGFDRIWLISWLDRAQGWKPRVLPPRGGSKRGVLATRAPHRPNPIGLSAVRLDRIEGHRIFIEDHDLLDGTPIIDIKPYLPYSDAHPGSAAGWAEEGWAPHEVVVEKLASTQLAWLGPRKVPLEDRALPTLRFRPMPSRGHRVKEMAQRPGVYTWCWRTWRIDYRVDPAAHRVSIEAIRSGRTDDRGIHEADGPGDGVEIHAEFNQAFQN